MGSAVLGRAYTGICVGDAIANGILPLLGVVGSAGAGAGSSGAAIANPGDTQVSDRSEIVAACG